MLKAEATVSCWIDIFLQYLLQLGQHSCLGLEAGLFAYLRAGFPLEAPSVPVLKILHSLLLRQSPTPFVP